MQTLTGLRFQTVSLRPDILQALKDRIGSDGLHLVTLSYLYGMLSQSHLEVNFETCGSAFKVPDAFPQLENVPGFELCGAAALSAVTHTICYGHLPSLYFETIKDGVL